MALSAYKSFAFNCNGSQRYIAESANGTVAATTPWVRPGEFSEISYQKNGRNRPMDSPCDHFKSRDLVAPGYSVLVPHHTGNASVDGAAPPQVREMILACRNALKSDLTVPYELVERTRESYPAIAEHWSSINTLLDGISLRAIPAVWDRLSRFGRRITPFGRPLQVAVATHPLRSLVSDTERALDQAANDWLGTVYGALPLLSDLAAIRSNFFDLEQRLETLTERSKEYQTASGTWVNPNLTIELTPLGGIPFTAYSDTVRGTINGSIHAKFVGYEVWKLLEKYRFDMPDLSDFRYVVAAYLDMLGLHPDISTVWDAIPLSFVVDWLTPTDEVIDRLTDQTWANIPITHLGTSLTLRRKGKLLISYEGPGVSGMSTCNVSFFKRFADPSAAIGSAVHQEYLTSGLTQILSGVALAFQRR